MFYFRYSIKNGLSMKNHSQEWRVTERLRCIEKGHEVTLKEKSILGTTLYHTLLVDIIRWPLELRYISFLPPKKAFGCNNPQRERDI